MSDLISKVAIVTGATSGIGKETAILLTERGWTVVATGRNEEALASLKSKGIAATIAADITSADSPQNIVDFTLENFGQIDGIAHAAGILTSGGIETETDEGFLHLMDINVTSSWRILKAAWDALKESKGSVVMVSSVTGLRSFPGLIGYCVSKSAVDQMVRCAALEGAPLGIRVNGVNPGVVVTNLHKAGGMDEKSYAAFLEHSKETHPLGRVGEPEEIAEAITWLMGDDTAWITGMTMPVDGGRQLTCAR